MHRRVGTVADVPLVGLARGECGLHSTRAMGPRRGGTCGLWAGPAGVPLSLLRKARADLGDEYPVFSRREGVPALRSVLAPL